MCYVDVIVIHRSESTTSFKSNDELNMASISFFEKEAKKILVEFYQCTYVNISKSMERKTLFFLSSNRTTARTMMVSLLLLVLIVLSNGCFASLVKTNGSEITKPVVQPRWLINFAQFVAYYTGRNPLDYNNYGCW